MQIRSFVLMLLLGLSFQVVPSVAQVPQGEIKFTPAQLQEDFAFLKKSIGRVHPDLSYSADMGKLDQAYKTAEQELQKPLTRNQAWRALASLNPVFSDAHMQVSMGDIEQEAAAHLKAGGGFFPFEVHVDGKGDVFIRAEMGGAATPLVSRRIETINGVPARTVTKTLLALMYGDTPAFRTNLLSGRWWRFYWRTYGAPAHFDLTLAKAGGRERIRRSAAPRLPFQTDNTFEKAYQFDMLSDKVALLSIDSFQWPDKNLFYAFTEKVFTQLRDAKVGALVIDIRNNGGGDDDMWKQGLLRYIANKPYQHTSAYRKMVIEGRSSATEKVGDIISGRMETWHQPEPDNPLHFSGKIYVVVGRTTYSSSILFSNTMQDFKFATIVGEDGYARARQSGGIQYMLLPNTKIELIVPRFILDRPSGAPAPELIRPDLVMADDPFKRRAIIDALHARILQGN
ncbi:MAG: S41 family peptidase [Pseudomonadota bacterium]